MNYLEEAEPQDYLPDIINTVFNSKVLSEAINNLNVMMPVIDLNDYGDFTLEEKDQLRRSAYEGRRITAFREHLTKELEEQSLFAIARLLNEDQKKFKTTNEFGRYRAMLYPEFETEKLQSAQRIVRVLTMNLIMVGMTFTAKSELSKNPDPKVISQVEEMLERGEVPTIQVIRELKGQAKPEEKVSLQEVIRWIKELNLSDPIVIEKSDNWKGKLHQWAKLEKEYNEGGRHWSDGLEPEAIREIEEHATIADQIREADKQAWGVWREELLSHNENMKKEFNIDDFMFKDAAKVWELPHEVAKEFILSSNSFIELSNKEYEYHDLQEIKEEGAKIGINVDVDNSQMKQAIHDLREVHFGFTDESGWEGEGIDLFKRAMAYLRKTLTPIHLQQFLMIAFHGPALDEMNAKSWILAALEM